MSINTSRLLRELASRFWSLFYGGCKPWTLRQVPTTFTFFILGGYKWSKGRQLQICITTYVSRKNCSDSRPWAIFAESPVVEQFDLTLLVSSAWRGSYSSDVMMLCLHLRALAKSGYTQHRLSPCFQCLSATLRHHSLPPLTSSYIHFVRKSLHRVLNLH